MKEIQSVIDQYYPRGVSYYSGKYEETIEYRSLMNVLSKKAKGWADFIGICINEFGQDSVDDRTNGEPGHVLLLHVNSNEKRYVIIWYIARILDAYCYRVQQVHAATSFPDFKDSSPKEWNVGPADTKHFIQRLTEFTRTHFPGYTLFDKNPDEIVPYISTYVRDIGEATLLNVFFTNYSY